LRSRNDIPFNFTMSRRSFVLLLIWLLVHSVWIPILSNWHMQHYPGVFTPLQYNIMYYVVSFGFVIIAAWKYLRAEFDTLMDNGFRTIVAILRAMLINFALSMVVAQVILIITGGDLTWLTTPNDAAVMELAYEDSYKMMALTVFLAPVIEEVLYRGVIFGALRKRDKLIAYIVSITLFSLAHVWQFAVVSMDLSVLLYALSYIPASFVLAWCYDKTGSIWTGILFHMGNNLFGMSVLF